MRTTLAPHSTAGKWSAGLLTAFFVLFALHRALPALASLAGTAARDLYFPFPMPVIALVGVLAFIAGLVSIVRRRERSVIVYLSVVLGVLILAWTAAELIWPH